MRKIAFGAALFGLAIAGPALGQPAPQPSAPSTQPNGSDTPPPPISPPPSTPVETPAPPLPSQAPESMPLIDLSQIETNDLRLLYFDPAETYLTPYVGRAAENALAFQERIFGWRPWERATLLLKDFSDYGNAGARASPNDALLIDIAPLSQTYETFSAGERFFTISNHELTHVATMDVWNSTDAFWRHLLGGKPMAIQEHPESILYNFLATPRVATPRWYLEGSAVFMETWMAGGFGRAQGGYDEMVFRAMVRDNAYFYSPVGLESEGINSDFQVGVNDYLYGTRFISYLALVYSPERVLQWLRRDPGSAGYYSVQFRRVFGRSLDQAWQDWIVWEHTFQHQNLTSVRAYPETTVTPLEPRALGSISRSFIDPQTGNLIGAFRYPGVIGHVGVLTPGTGAIRHLTDIKGQMLYRVTSLAYDPQSETAWFTEDNYAYRDIIQVDIATGHRRMVLHDARIGDLVFNPADRSLWGLRHLNGYVTLVRIPPPYTSWNQVYTFPFGIVPFDPDISADGAMLSMSVGEPNAHQTVQVFRMADLANLGEAAPQPIASFSLGSSTPEGFVFSPDGRYLYGNAYYTGVSNIYRFEIATQQTELVSNASTGFFRPIPRPDGSLVVYEYTGQGFRPGTIQPTPLQDAGAITFLGAQIAQQHPVVTTWGVGSPSHVPFDSMVTQRDHYVPRNEMRLGAAYPVIEGYRGLVAGGYHVIFEDPLQFNQFTATVSYDPSSRFEDQNWHIDLAYHNLSWRFRYRHNDADFYDIAGPTYRSRAGDAGTIGYHHSLIYDVPRQLDFETNLNYYSGLDTLPGAQDIGSQFDNLVTLDAGLTYTNETRSLGAVDHERGWRWNLNGEVDYANREYFPSLRGGLDFGVPLPWGNSSVWLYTAAGAVGGDRNSVLSSFYMGGFGNNYVDDREVKRYRQFDSFPGFDIDEISAHRFARVLGEINLPPIRFRDIGTPSLYLSNARTALFAGVLQAEPSIGDTRTLETAGIQVDFNFTAALRLPMVLSVGFARGFEDGEARGDETLVSLKIM